MADRVGFIGLGAMGFPMAANLVAAGAEVIVSNRSSGPVDRLEREGARRAGSLTELVENSDVVITMLPDSADVADVLRGPGGIFSALRSGQLLIDMSTISPVVTRELASEAGAMGADFLDAPVSGGDVGAREGTLAIMVGGAAAALERARPLFDVMGASITHVGDVGAGQVVKAANQIVVATTLAAIGEALVLATHNGVTREHTLSVLGGGGANSRMLELKRTKLATQSYEPTFRATLQSKDLGIALASARESGVPLPLTAIVDQLYRVVESKGWGGLDHSVVVRAIELLAAERGTEESEESP